MTAVRLDGKRLGKAQWRLEWHQEELRRETVASTGDHAATAAKNDGDNSNILSVGCLGRQCGGYQQFVARISWNGRVCRTKPGQEMRSTRRFLVDCRRRRSRGRMLGGCRRGDQLEGVMSLGEGHGDQWSLPVVECWESETRRRPRGHVTVERDMGIT